MYYFKRVYKSKLAYSMLKYKILKTKKIYSKGKDDQIGLRILKASDNYIINVLFFYFKKKNLSIGASFWTWQLEGKREVKTIRRDHAGTKPPNTISTTKCLIKIWGSIDPTIDHKIEICRKKSWASLKKDGWTWEG